MAKGRYLTGVCLAAAVWAAAPCAAQLDQVGPLSGDLNGDSFVGIEDLSIVLMNWGQTVTPGDWARGDPSGDGTVGIEDINIVLSNWNVGYPLPQQRNLNLGINLSQVNYYNREWVFVDAIKQSRPWVSTNPNGLPFDTGQPVLTDPQGWPLLAEGEAAQTMIFNQTEGAYPAGQYVCTFEGSGQIIFQWDANPVSSEPGRIVLDVTPTDTGILMRIAQSDPADPIRNIKLWLPGFEGAASPFHPLFLQRMSPFKVIRFMDWAKTNTADDTVSWTTRTLPTHHSQDRPRGVAIEHMIQLCNELGADPWFCVPHTADDLYIQNFATLVRNQLDPQRKIYLEWSNEVWNDRFDAHGWITQQSGSPPFSAAWFHFWSRRVLNSTVIWEEVFEEESDRLVRVVAGQASNVWVTKNLAQRLGHRVDAVSCAAYFGESGASFDANTTAHDIVGDAINRAIPVVSADGYIRHGNLAQNLSNDLGKTVRLIGYEGGQHYADDNRNVPYAQALLDAQYLPKMFSAYLMNLNAFEQAGADLMLPFNYVDSPGSHGAWGHLEHQDDALDNSEKFRALLYYIKDQP